MQLDELSEDVPREKVAVVYDYEAKPGNALTVLERLAEMPFRRLVPPTSSPGCSATHATRTHST